MPKRKGRPVLHAVTVLSLLAGSAYFTYELRKDEEAKVPAVQAVTDRPDLENSGKATGKQTWERLHNPTRSVLRGENGDILGTFTDGARTATLRGPSRTFTEPANTQSRVVTQDWVRLMPEAWHKGAEKEKWFKDWFKEYNGSEADDIFAIAFQYVQGAPVKKDDEGVPYAGDAVFGPFKADGVDRLEQNDFYDYLGINYTFRNGTTMVARKERYRALDCSGFMRMVWGYRARFPLMATNTDGDGLPRSADGMARSKVGVDVLKLSGPSPWYTRPQNIDVVQPGDLLFFKMDHRTGNHLDHVAMYLGVDTDGHRVFISSRKEVNGPTMGDKGGASRIDGNGFYAGLLRSAKRL
ncbi:NlpC/P60 family protein [Streptomyces collinus]|uniref:Secreted protein n=1 Tax=Streptomyces collinus (strain DSM 40733 / Tue 365) TaxID=1214242 RepID=S5UZ65_STRC3|nr:NlpC/P60 family protein [Streptomyces collinus]AGS72618.1 secreted protein [Streptomyces collinus Tu 365]UJA11279.1 secreted protein [Streptomyces collinus]UJA13855.1 secreted protein [Streptomyces collinus]